MEAFRRIGSEAARIVLTSLVVLAAAAAAGAPWESASAEGCDALGASGEETRFRLLHFGSRSGEERFGISRSGDSDTLLVDAEATANLAGRSFTMRQRLAVDRADLSLLDYRLSAQVGGEDQEIRAFRKGDSVVVVVDGPSGRFRRAFAERGRVFVLDNLLANHLALLACRSAERGYRPETLRVVVPQVGAVLPATILPGEAAADGAREITVRIASVTEVLSVDAGGNLLEIEVPSQAIRYERVAAGEGREVARPGEPRLEYAPEERARPTRVLFEEQTVRFTSKGTDLYGILTLPRGGQAIPYTAALLVQDAGPLDRDAGVGPNAPFRDLARGLAVAGIASLRYDKRTLAAPETIDPRAMTVQEEVIDDALAALEYLRSQTEISRKRIGVVGHGLGGGPGAGHRAGRRRDRLDRRAGGVAATAR